MEPVRAARATWCTAVDQLHENLEKPSSSELAVVRAKAALQALDKLPWKGTVKGFRAGSSVENLAHLFTTDWLNTDHEDQMLELLAADLGLGIVGRGAIQSTFFTLRLAQAYSNPEKYQTDPQFNWLRRLGSQLAMKEHQRLGGIVNVHDNHWIALTIDCKNNIVGYGDGFRQKAPANLCAHVDWWLFQHLGVKFKWKDIPVAKQIDPHSCGILAYHTLANWFGSKRFPLPESTAAASMADERIKFFLRIIERHERQVCGHSLKLNLG
jgi:hypothetical protein